MDKNLNDFLDGLKKKKGKDDTNFILDDLLKNISEQVVFTTHGVKFSNPNVKNELKINVWASNSARNDGYVRTGNYGERERDVTINAAFLSCPKFINLVLDSEDKKTLYHHVINKTEYIKDCFKSLDYDFQKVFDVFSAIKFGNETNLTSKYISQVYFPIDEENYHLLSILYPSTGLFLIKHKDNNFKFLDDVKKIRDLKKENKFSDKEIHDLYDLVEIGFGGDKPQNISYINNKESGKAYLFLSKPPVLTDKEIYPPKKNIFKENINYYSFQNEFNNLDKFFKINYNNINIRNYRDNLLLNIFDKVVDIVYKIRTLGVGWSDDEKYTSLPIYQKVILDSKYEGQLKTESSYIDKFIEETARWIIFTYEHKYKKNNISLGDDILLYFANYLKKNKEILQ